MDNNGRVIIWNRAIEEMTGVLADEIIGIGDYAYALSFYGEKRLILIDFVSHNPEEVSHLYEHVHKRGENLIAELYSDKMYGGKGAYLWGITTPLIDACGNVIGAIESIRDITERKNMEIDLIRSNEELSSSYEELARSHEEVSASLEELHAQEEQVAMNEMRFFNLVSHLPDGIIIYRGGKIRYANPAAVSLLKYTEESNLYEIDLFQIIHPRYIDLMQFHISETGLKTRHPIDSSFIRSDGMAIPVEVTTAPYSDEHGPGIMIIVRDMTGLMRKTS
jgi:PAS domain S-box-containing protein